jgi:hypothetical protein
MAFQRTTCFLSVLVHELAHALYALKAGGHATSKSVTSLALNRSRGRVKWVRQRSPHGLSFPRRLFFRICTMPFSNSTRALRSRE